MHSSSLLLLWLCNPLILLNAFIIFIITLMVPSTPIPLGYVLKWEPWDCMFIFFSLRVYRHYSKKSLEMVGQDRGKEG